MLELTRAIMSYDSGQRRTAERARYKAFASPAPVDLLPRAVWFVPNGYHPAGGEMTLWCPVTLSISSSLRVVACFGRIPQTDKR
jgi:hypothetical protein